MPAVSAAYSVLIVEDDASLRELYRSALAAAGYTVSTVEDGRSALEIVQVHRPDVIVLDLELPRLNGRDVFREVRANPATTHIPVVVVTGSDTRDLDPRRFAYLLVKPIRPDVLVWSVQNAARTARPAPWDELSRM